MVLDWLTDPFTLGFMQRALVSCIAIGVAAPAIGIWAVSRRLVYLTDAMSHSVLAGVAAAAFVGGSLLVGGLAAGIVMAVLVAVLVLRSQVPEDSAIGVVGQGLFAVGVIGVSLVGDPRALSHVLFGNPLTLTQGEVVAQVALAVLLVAAGWFLGPMLRMATFDPVHARTVGVRTGLVDAGLIVALAIVVVACLASVGVLMAITLITAPAVAARLLARTVGSAVPLACGLGVLAGVVGLLASYHAGIPTGPAVALVSVGMVGVAAVLARFRFRRQPADASTPARATSTWVARNSNPSRS